MTAADGDVTTVSRPARLRATRQGAAVDAVLAGADGFLSAQAVHEELRRRGESVGLTTVYRHLNALAGAGQVDVVQRPEGEASYRLCGPASTGTSPGEPQSHHHHLVCRLCGHSVEVEGPEVEDWAARVALGAGFTDVTHTVEVFGVCPRHDPPDGGRTRRADRR